MRKQKRQRKVLSATKTERKILSKYSLLREIENNMVIAQYESYINNLKASIVMSKFKADIVGDDGQPELVRYCGL